MSAYMYHGSCNENVVRFMKVFGLVPNGDGHGHVSTTITVLMVAYSCSSFTEPTNYSLI